MALPPDPPPTWRLFLAAGLTATLFTFPVGCVGGNWEPFIGALFATALTCSMAWALERWVIR